MTRSLVTRGGSVVRQRNRSGQATGFAGRDETAPATRVEMGSPGVDESGRVTVNVVVPDGAPGVVLYGYDGRTIRVTQSGPVTFSRADVAKNAVAFVDLRAAVLPDGRPGPSVRVDFSGIVDPGPDPEEPDPEEPEEPEEPELPDPFFVLAPSLTWEDDPIEAGSEAVLVPALVNEPALLDGEISYAYERRTPPLGDEAEWAEAPVVPSLAADEEFRVIASATTANGNEIRDQSPWYLARAASGPRLLVPGTDFTVPLSEAREGAPEGSFTPVIHAPGLSALLGGSGVAQVTWADNLANRNAWHQVVAHATRGAGWYSVFARAHPVAPGATDAALFTAADARRIGKMRLHYSESADELESGPWSEPVDVPLPAVSGVAPALRLQFPALIEATAGQVVTIDVTEYLEANTLTPSFSRSGAGADAATIHASTGVLTFAAGAAGAAQALVITVANSAGNLDIATSVRSNAPAPVQSAPELAVAFPPVIQAEAGQTVTVDVAAMLKPNALPVTGYARAGAVNSTAINAAGVFTFNAPNPAPGGNPAPVTITVTNAIGSLVINTSVQATAPAVDQKPTLVGAFPALIQAESGQSVTVEVSQFVQSPLPITGYARTGAGAGATTINAATGRLVFTAGAAGAPQAVAITVTNSAGSLVINTSVQATAVVVPPTAGLPSPTVPILQQAMTLGFLNWNFTQNPADANRVATMHNVVGIGIAAMNGATAPVVNGRNPVQYLLQQMQNTCAGANTEIGNRAPAGRGGVTMQRDMAFACAAALARVTPAVWNALTAAERNKIDCIMRGLAVSACFQNSDTNPWVQAGVVENERRIDGGQFTRNRVYNFTAPSFLMPLIVNGFMGGGTALRNYLNTFDRAVFAAECQTRGLWHMWETFRQDLKQPAGNAGNPPNRLGPTKAQLEQSVRGNYRMTLGGTTYRTENQADTAALMIREINRMWNSTIKSGLTNVTKVPFGFTIPPAGSIGIFEPRPQDLPPEAPSRNLSRNAWVGRLMNLNDWQFWVAEGLDGQIGAPVELDSTDGGDDLPTNDPRHSGGPRSDLEYAMDGMMICLMATTTLAAQGQLPRTDNALRAAFQRQGRGARHMELLGQYGYRGFSKGGRPWVGGNRNADWINGGPDEQGYRAQVLWALWSQVLKPWHDA